MNETIDVIVVDDDFLSQVEAVEKNVIYGGKRRKIDGDGNGGGRSVLEKSDSYEEGVYTAALRGSKSLLWQHTTSESLQSRAKGRVKVVAENLSSIRVDGGGGGGSCFKCGKLGHWSRDCSDVGGVGEGNFGSNDSDVAVKACPCKMGSCLVLTANTEKNRGRKFYRCPVREENGGCGFFEWCDILGASMSTEVRNFATPSVPDLHCQCGAGSCAVLTAKTGKNIGQQFYRCPANQGNSCGFFKWCSENTISASLPMSASQSYGNFNDSSSKISGLKTGSSCFKCGQEGHWARDCPKPSSVSSVDVGGGRQAASSGTCYKCGKLGHWARDCPSQDMKIQRRT